VITLEFWHIAYAALFIAGLCVMLLAYTVPESRAQ
jgi:hypothetical protein